MAIARHAIVTGGSSGIGKATALLLAQRGADVTILARRPELLEAARDEIFAQRASERQRVAARSVDVADRAAVAEAVAAAVQEFGPCDLLVACAGIARPGYFSEIPDDVFERTMAVNYFGTLHAIQAALPGMRQLGGGHISIVSSGAGIMGIYGYTPYSPSKFAQRGLAEVLRAELKRERISVSIVYPPDTDTPQLAEEMKTKPLETQAITGAAKVWSAQAVASCIVEGVERKRFLVAPGMEMMLLFKLHSMFFSAINWYFDSLASKAKR